MGENSLARRGHEGPTPSPVIDAWIAHDRPVTVAIVALASFEIINAAYGRDTGDALLKVAIDRLGRVLSATDDLELSREGAVFTLALPLPFEAAHPLIAAIEFALAQPFAVGATTVHVGTRIGVASGQGEEAEALVARARAALADARVLEGATTRIAPPAPHRPIAQLAADLHRAIERDEIAVLFQPQVAFGNGRIEGVEALARWNHPELGELGAQTLLAASDRADLGLVLSDHILARALASAAGWSDALKHLRVAVNVTAADLSRPDFAARFLARVDTSGIARARVTAEITEGGLIDDLDGATELLATLRDGGCRVAIDDFGTGYSSLAYLTALPVDYLKIDLRLTQSIVGDRRHRAVVEGVIAIANALGLETIAEGVETEEQRALLEARGCTYYQGFLCSAALDSATLARLVGVA
ncbi:GGDEF domain-containing phosphodiesterase [Sphingomonas sp. Mn802worker]|uniref:GGDEF domain-containing phosphodiesterase n=1 Tax=Sphingomonas sp. Mn802worker TaxID=629773 RepID=UPI00036075B4|nr:GGDEF domain-containing phosphodiesterase [Sphingomonas sp. Mn802worker]